MLILVTIFCHSEEVLITFHNISVGSDSTHVVLRMLIVNAMNKKVNFVLCFPILSEGKISPDEPAILPPLPIVPKTEKRKSIYGTPQSKRFDYRDREWDRERDRDFELMPPPGSHKKDYAVPVDADQPIDPNEPTYCVCHQVLPSHFCYFQSELSCDDILQFLQLFLNVCCMYSTKVIIMILQVSFGDMIACDNENVSPFCFIVFISYCYFLH